MELDSIQWTTQTTLTTSLAKKDSQKSSFLDVSLEINPTSSANDPTPVMTPPVKSDFFDDNLHKEDLPLNPPLSLPAPRPSPTTPYLSVASITEATARLKNSLNRPPVQTNQILPQYFFQA